jgi:hypothetical protein
MVKTTEAAAYQMGAALLVRTARPSGWRQQGQVICEYRFWISRDADCTNMIKVLEDAIFPALGINDSWALPRAMSKEIVKRGEEKVEVTIA